MPQQSVLFVSYDGLTDHLGQSQILPYLSGLQALGHSIHILSAEKKLVYEKQCNTVQKLVDSAGLQWHHTWFTQGIPIAGKLYDLYTLASSIVRICKQHSIVVLHCRSYVSMQAGMLAQKKLPHLKIIFDIRGFWVDERVDSGAWNTKQFFYKQLYNYYKRKEKKMYAAATHIVSLTYAAQKIIASTFLRSEKDITVIPCCADMNLYNYKSIDQEKVKALQAQWQLQSTQHVVMYAGSIGGWYLTQQMIKLMERMYAINNNLVFFFLTKDTAALQQYLQHSKLPASAVRYTEANRAEMPYYYSLAHVGLYFIKPTYSKQASSPTKQAEMMAMQLPIVTNSGTGDTDDFIEKYNAGFVIKDAIHITNNDVEQALAITKPSQGAYTCAMQEYTLAEGIKRYHSIYSSIQ